jgi:hypothetical protein
MKVDDMISQSQIVDLSPCIPHNENTVKTGKNRSLQLNLII